MTFGRLLFRMRNPLAALPLAYALFSTTWTWEADAVVWTIGGALAVMGVVLRGWATCHCRYSTGQKKLLAFTGPYAWIRNPLYVGNLAIILGAVVASELEWFVPIAALWSFGVYYLVAEYEESVMLAKFGDDYRRYRDAVPAWFPRLQKPAGPTVSLPTRSLIPAVLRQAGNLGVLAPFVMKEMNMFGLGCGP